MKVLVDYPNEQEEFVIVERMTSTLLPVNTVMSTPQLIELQAEADKVYADPALMEYAVRLVAATRHPDEYGVRDIAKYILYGCSPRASINLILTGRALAFLRGRSYVLAQDIHDMALDVMRHRLVLSYEALSDSVTSDMVLARVMEQVTPPVMPLQPHVVVSVNA
jgi:MoxR-like ATPase